MRHCAPGLAIVTVFLVSSCDIPEPVSPHERTSSISSDFDERPYYWHQNERVHLQAEYGRVVVAYQDGVANEMSITANALDVFGIVVDRSDAVRQIDGHRVLFLSGDRGNGPAAVAALRQQPGIEFAAPVYSMEGRDTLLLVNELVVHFRDGVTQASIDNLVETVGARIVRYPRPK